MKKTKKMPGRMLAIANLVDSAKTVADVGCDHAYISIHLIENGKAERVIASDLREGPLKIARGNIKSAGLEEKIETRLCSGLCGYEPNEVDTVLISGMGGMLVREILSESRDVVNGADTLILEPQSDLRIVRAYLREIGFAVIDEDMLSESGKYYQIIKAKKGNSKRSFTAEDEFGPILIRKKHPVLKEFLIKRKRHFEELLQNREFLQSQNNLDNGRVRVIEEELALVCEAISRF